MLTSILNNFPLPRCVIIQDSLSVCGRHILLSIIKTHLDIKNHEVHFFVFENNADKIKNKFQSDKLHVYDCVTNGKNWINNLPICNFKDGVANTSVNGIIVIDSLAHVILEHGVPETYRILHHLLNQRKERIIVQIATILHEDAVENKTETLKYFDHISTINMQLIEIPENNPRVEYIYKKPGGKIIKKVEEYYFNGEVFHTRELEKVDRKVLLPDTTPEQLPHNLSTFKISLDESEKKSREQLTLPYMKSNIEQLGQGGGSVIYNMDDVDDWDEEDPDDDLDI